MNKTFIIAEIGINHNGDLNIAKELIDGAVEAGCDMVKFQKRTLDLVYEREDLDRPRESPWGTTNRQQKEGLEFSLEEYKQIDQYCKSKNIEWCASAWDVPSQLFTRQFNLNYNKVASAMLTHRELLETIAEEGKHTFISTGMSTIDQITAAVKIFRDAGCSFELMHCNSTYPMDVEDAIIASDFLDCDKILGYHYDTFGYIKIEHKESIQKFFNKGKDLMLLEIGDSIEL